MDAGNCIALAGARDVHGSKAAANGWRELAHQLLTGGMGNADSGRYICQGSRQARRQLGLVAPGSSGHASAGNVGSLNICPRLRVRSGSTRGFQLGASRIGARHLLCAARVLFQEEPMGKIAGGNETETAEKSAGRSEEDF